MAPDTRYAVGRLVVLGLFVAAVELLRMQPPSRYFNGAAIGVEAFQCATGRQPARVVHRFLDGILGIQHVAGKFHGQLDLHFGRTLTGNGRGHPYPMAL